MYTHITRIGAAVSLFAYPLTALAIGTIAANPSIAGLGFDVRLSGAPAHADTQIMVVDPDGSQNAFRTTSDATGNAVVRIDGRDAQIAGSYTLRAVSGGVEQATGTATVEPDSIDPAVSSVRTGTPYIRADGRDSAKVEVRVRDRFGNPLSGRPVTLVSGRSSDTIEARTTETDAMGMQHFTVTTDEPGTMQLRAIDLLSGKAVLESVRIEASNPYATGGYDGAYTAQAYPNYPTYPTYPTYPSYPTPTQTTSPYRAQVGTTGTFDIIDRLIVTAPATATAGEDVSKLTVRAVDRNGNTVEDYRGTIRFITPTDPNATVPNFGSYTFRERDFGEMTFALALRFNVGGQQTVRIEDVNDPRIFGETTITVSGGDSQAGNRAIEVTSHMDGDFVNSDQIIIEGTAPRFVNLIVMGGVTDAYGASDDQGFFSIPVTLNPNLQNFTIRVQDDARRYDSGPIVLTLDRTPPEIQTVTFSPEEPQEGEEVLVVVQSEPGLAQVFFGLPDRVNGIPLEVELAESPASPGTYQGFFSAPAAGNYQPSVAVLDKAGNVDELKTILTIGTETVDTVQNVRATPRVDAIDLTWDSVPGEVSGYRIYVGDDPLNYSYSLDTGRITTKASVKGLTPGQTYVFAITALRGTEESAEKSIPVEAQVLGFTLNVEPEDGALHVEWTSLSTDLPLSAFTLSYGTEQADLTEKRTLNGQIRDFTIRDLLNGVQYYIALTPITVTGETLDDLTVLGQGVPSGSGFNPSPRDDVPFNVGEPPVGGSLHGGAPSTPESGIPPFAWMSAVAAGVLGVLWHVRRRAALARSKAFLDAVQMRYNG